MKKITRSDADSPQLEFVYNPMGQRVLKITKPRSNNTIRPEQEWLYTYYRQLRCQRAGHGGVRCKDEHRKQPDLSFGAACVRSEPSGDGEAGQDGLQQWQ